MNYIQQYHQLKDLFDLNKDDLVIPGNETVIRNFEFKSVMNDMIFSDKSNDEYIIENNIFRYPVLIHRGKKRTNEAIIFLHGLNERTWYKHLTGAKYLAEKTGKAVIMFPLSFHINRGLPEWTDPRKMSIPLGSRKKKYPYIMDASLINLALSERLTEYPERFFLSGLQSTVDLTTLIEQIQSGNHPLFEKNTKTDLFAYSISCMLLQCLMISNPNGILNNSKLVLFAGGSLFSYINGMSKYIMDSVAFNSVRNFYMSLINNHKSVKADIQAWLMEHSFGKAFRSLLSPDFLKKIRQKALLEFSDNVMVIALRNDKIMPVEGIREAMGEKFFHSNNFRELHFSYSYTHENPFPVLYDTIEKEVEKAFQSVFTPAYTFFNI